MCMYVYTLKQINGGSLFEVANFILGIFMMANSLWLASDSPKPHLLLVKSDTLGEILIASRLWVVH